MNNWTEKERQFAFDEYNGNDETMVVSEWLNLCAKLHTDWKPVVPDTMEEKCEKQFVTMSGTDGVCTYAEFASNHDSEYCNGWTAAEKEAAFNEYKGSDTAINAAEWQALCAKLNTDWKPVVQPVGECEGLWNDKAISN